MRRSYFQSQKVRPIDNDQSMMGVIKVLSEIFHHKTKSNNNKALLLLYFCFVVYLQITYIILLLYISYDQNLLRSE